MESCRAFPPSGVGHLRRAILEVHVRDAAAVRAHECGRIAAAVGGVAGVDAQAKQLGGRDTHQGVDFVRCFDVGRGVVVERRREGHEGTKILVLRPREIAVSSVSGDSKEGGHAA